MDDMSWEQCLTLAALQTYRERDQAKSNQPFPRVLLLDHFQAFTHWVPRCRGVRTSSSAIIELASVSRLLNAPVLNL